ncbi:MAG: type I DNA topoisomerase, partial [Deltaproteobacteria bacterium]|nr:type I DNA topoisomerase [Deltaproteobacteria bacterium]
MGKSLVIVESPAKARTINKYLGKDFVVKSSVGHVRDLPVSGSGKNNVDPAARARAAAETRKLPPAKRAAHKKKKARASLIARMGLDPEKGWKARYEILPGKEKVVEDLKRLAKTADHVFLATDLDREGEAIAWHLREVIGGPDKRFKRVVFNEITKTAIQAAFEEPGDLDLSRVNAQQARRFLDRVVGYMVSPLLWAKVARGLSAGRVQSVAVRLLVEREQEIHAFIPEEFWEVYAELRTESTPRHDLRMQVAKRAGENFRPTSKAETDEALALLEAGGYEIVRREDKPTSTRPSAPYITSTLQQAASTRLGFSVKKTMMLAQRLYEAGHITYMRTDSTNLSGEAVQACRELIGERFGAQYLPDKAPSYASKEGAQEAHEAIRPSEVSQSHEDLAGLERDQLRLYELIWRQFVACQMPPARYLSTTVAAGCGDFELRVRGRILQFDGYTKVQPPGSKKQDDVALPDVQVGEALVLRGLDPSQHFTKPPPRFTEASLVKELEKRGIGRPSTYASIISTIQDRGYARVENRRFYAEKMGEIVTERLVESFGDLMDFGFTAQMEEVLDDVAVGKVEWKKVLNDFYRDFKKKLAAAGAEKGGMRQNDPTDTDIPCPKCGRHMQIRTASTGVFLGCSGYALPPKERCKSTLNLVSGDEAISADEAEDEESEARLLRKHRRCPRCNTSMDCYLIDEKRKLHVCGKGPDCLGYEVEEGQFVLKGYDGPVLECDKCGADMQLKTGRFGKYFGCTAEECKNTRKLLRSGEPAPPKVDPIPMPHLRCVKCDDFFLLRDGAAGIFLAASQFPKHRETRAPLVEEIVAVAEQLDDKYKFLAAAPPRDPDGNPTMVRYARKTKQQYVMSDVDGKASGWRAFYTEGKWVADAMPPKT